MANREHLKRLRSGVADWNMWRRGTRTRPNLSDAQLRGADLRDANLSRAKLRGADLSRAQLRGAGLSGADLRRVDLGYADLSGADLSNADLRDADLSYADLSGADLSNADLRDVDPSYAKFSRAKFRSTDLRGVDLRDEKLRGADLRDADLSDANLNDADLRGADLSHARLTGAKLTHADLSRARLTGAKLRGLDLRRVGLSGADLRGADLRDADLSGASLIRADLRDADLRDADLRRVVLADGDGNSANLYGANLVGARFTSIQESLPEASVLELLAADGLETASFDSPEVLRDYVAQGFDYAHRPELEEAVKYPEFLQKALQRIKAMRALFADQDPPDGLIPAIRVITTEIMAYLKKRPDAMRDLRPRQFEELIAEILASFGWQVQLTPATRDGGYDMFAISRDDRADVETSWIIECKKYAPERKVGIDVVRALYGVKIKLEVANMMLATTSHFTSGVQQLKASQYDLELKDYEGMLEWINEYRPNPDGKLYIRDNQLVLPGD